MKATEYTITKQIQNGVKKKETGTIMGVIGEAKTDFDWIGNFPLDYKKPKVSDLFLIQEEELDKSNSRIKKLEDDVLTLKRIIYDLLEQEEIKMKGEF